VLVLLGSIVACDAPAERQEDKKAEAKADFKEPSEMYRGGDIGPPETALTSEDGLAGQDAPPPCPDDHAMLGDGSCAPDEEFYVEQEVLDAKVIQEIQTADTAQAQVKAQEHFIESQARQIEKAEEDLDEIIRDLKRKKRAKRDLND
jgi:hypothetical protein